MVMNVAASAPVVSAARSETPTPLWRGRRRNTTIHNAASFCENSADERSDGNTHGCRHNHRLTRLFKQASEQIKHQCCRVLSCLQSHQITRPPAKVVACRGDGRREAAPLLSKPIVPKSGQSVSQSVISRSRPALTPPPARSPAPPLPAEWRCWQQQQPSSCSTQRVKTSRTPNHGSRYRMVDGSRARLNACTTSRYSSALHRDTRKIRIPLSQPLSRLTASTFRLDLQKLVFHSTLDPERRTAAQNNSNDTEELEVSENSPAPLTTGCCRAFARRAPAACR